MLHAANVIGRPDRRWHLLHIAGTNGKGSVAATCSLAVQLAGYRVGLFTSPHMLRFAERIRINQEPIPDDLLAYSLERALRFDLSFFELSFIASLIAFDQSDIDCAVLEVGLGGRLDATNIVEKPLVSAVTKIAMDHTQVLGNSLKDIAYEKACIAKPGCTMVIGNMDATARNEVQRVASHLGATPIVFADDSPWHTTNIETSLRGRHQIDNASVTSAICFSASHGNAFSYNASASDHSSNVGSNDTHSRNRVGPTLDRLNVSHVREAIANVKWPCRMESVFRDNVEYLLDGAHNADGVDALARYVEARGIDRRNVALIFGVMSDKAWPSMITRLRTIASHRFYVEPHGRTPASASSLASVVPGRTCRSVSEAIADSSRHVDTGGLVVVCGSLFLAAEARALLLDLEMDRTVAL